MIESLKKKLETLLQQKEVSLAMVYDRSGRILWSTGRKIKGKTILEGEGFPKSDIMKTMVEGNSLTKEGVVISAGGEGLPRSARMLYVRSLIIKPITSDYFLYIDSGIKESFSPTDLEVFNVVGELLGEVIGQIRRSGQETGGITGTSAAIQQLRELVITYSIEEEPVLLSGETGTGKNHIAELIHRFSGKPGKFVMVHSPSIPESLFESEIFGHKKGSFTGAHENRKGLVEEAAEGTIFFDEIAEVPLSFQAKLLQFLDTQKFRVLGESTERHARTRIVAATNRDLLHEVKNKTFREDLYFRLNVLPIEIPPLRDRPEDIRALVDEYNDLLRGKRTEPPFWDCLLEHSWPGNVRELIHVLKRAGIQMRDDSIGREIEAIIQGSQTQSEKGTNSLFATLSAEMGAGKNFWDTLWKAFINREISRNELKMYLVHHFLSHDKSLKKMSQALHIDEKDYPRFVSALHKYNIHPGK